jgi:hypothetical protein
VSGIAFVEAGRMEQSLTRRVSSFNGDHIMNELHIIARVAQSLLAIGVVIGSVLVFEYGYYAI